MARPKNWSELKGTTELGDLAKRMVEHIEMDPDKTQEALTPDDQFQITILLGAFLAGFVPNDVVTGIALVVRTTHQLLSRNNPKATYSDLISSVIEQSKAAQGPVPPNTNDKETTFLQLNNNAKA